MNYLIIYMPQIALGNQIKTIVSFNAVNPACALIVTHKSKSVAGLLLAPSPSRGRLGWSWVSDVPK
jgi:hypothetical protein